MGRENKIFIGASMFKRIENLDGYFVSACGKVYSQMSRKILNTTVSKNGYERIKLRGKHYFVHRLVVKTWIGKIGHGKGCKMQVDHIDSNKLNNHLSNLRILNNKDNRGRANGMFYGSHKTSGGKWMAQIRVNGWLQYLGTYETKEQAHARYKIARMLLSAQ